MKNLNNDISEEASTNATSGIAGVDGDYGPSGKFAGSHIFRVSSSTYNKCIKGKKRCSRWENYIDWKADPASSAIRDYAYKYPKRAIIVQNEIDNSMLYLRQSKWSRRK